MKPRMFVASSSEHIDLAYAVQEALERDAEITVWDQGVFTPSRSTMASLIDALDESDFGLFIMGVDDVTNIRDSTKKTVRDNVIFELGMFVGRLGFDRCFMVVPRGVEDLHLPTDLLGLTPAMFDPDRQDLNLVAALGPACNRIRKVIKKLGPIMQQASSAIKVVDTSDELISNPDDCMALIQSWMGARPASENSRAIRYADVDRELKLAPGSAEKYIESVASKWSYVVAHKGKDVILFEQNFRPVSGGRRKSYFDDFY